MALGLGLPMPPRGQIAFASGASVALDFVNSKYRIGAGGYHRTTFDTATFPTLTLANTPTIDSSGILFNGSNQSAVLTGITNATPCTIFVELVTITATDFRHFMNWTDGSSANRIGAYYAFSDNAQFAVAGGVDATGSPRTPGSASAGVTTRMAMVLNGTSLKAFGGGEKASDMTLGTSLSLTTLTLGREPGFSFWNGRIRKLLIYPYALTDAELLALTA